MKLKSKIILMAVAPLVLLALLVILVVNSRVTTLMEDEISQSLQATAYVYRDAISNLDENEYYLDVFGNLWNGDEYNVSEDTEMIDDLSEKTGISLTVFYGDTRAVTSLVDGYGNRMTGSKAGATAIEKVLNNGEEYFAVGIDIGGSKYYGYYIPIYNGEETTAGEVEDIAGMVFAGMPKSIVSGAVVDVVLNTAILIVVVLVIMVILAWVIASKMSKRFVSSVKSIEQVADGDFTVTVDDSLLKAKDESGDIARSVNDLQKKLNEAFKAIKSESNNVDENAASLGEASEECANVIGQVEIAVGDISEGATSQAADTTDATTKVIEMGDMVVATNESVKKLIAISENMEKEGKEAASTLEKLGKINEETKVAIDEIYTQTNTTNASALKINEAVAFITSIAEETNLLSLNASIEAARAGEQGRGFAVVASQIQKLAEQSNESAKAIEQVIRTLIADSDKSVETMNSVKEIMEKQSAMVAETEEIFKHVISGVASTEMGVKEISANMTSLDSSRTEVVDIVSNLSAIAEENAASTEETSASVTEVSASVQQVSASAATLKNIADDLNELVDRFKIAE